MRSSLRTLVSHTRLTQSTSAFNASTRTATLSLLLSNVMNVIKRKHLSWCCFVWSFTSPVKKLKKRRSYCTGQRAAGESGWNRDTFHCIWKQTGAGKSMLTGDKKVDLGLVFQQVLVIMLFRYLSQWSHGKSSAHILSLGWFSVMCNVFVTFVWSLAICFSSMLGCL